MLYLVHLKGAMINGEFEQKIYFKRYYFKSDFCVFLSLAYLRTIGNMPIANAKIDLLGVINDKLITDNIFYYDNFFVFH